MSCTANYQFDVSAENIAAGYVLGFGGVWRYFNARIKGGKINRRPKASKNLLLDMVHFNLTCQAGDKRRIVQDSLDRGQPGELIALSSR